MLRIVILTGSELRHDYFRLSCGSDPRLSVIKSFCENSNSSFGSSILQADSSSGLQKMHFKARVQSEVDFFAEAVSSIPDHSVPALIERGDVNKDEFVDSIIEMEPDLIVCYGCSIIKSNLLKVFHRKILNVHLGLSPYYRGSGTNVWPLINLEPELVGATFMYLDSGVDTGEVIHQIRAKVFLGDGPHSIGNRLIKDMVKVYIELLANFHNIIPMQQIEANGHLYKNKDFDDSACARLYSNFEHGLVYNHLLKESHNYKIVENEGLKF